MSGVGIGEDEIELRALVRRENAEGASFDSSQEGPASTVALTQSPAGGYMWMARWSSGLVRSAGPFPTRDAAAESVRASARLGASTSVRVEGRSGASVSFLDLPASAPRNESVPLEAG